jgi:hypothetical protein
VNYQPALHDHPVQPILLFRWTDFQIRLRYQPCATFSSSPVPLLFSPPKKKRATIMIVARAL